jgi:hypothetical protein
MPARSPRSPSPSNVVPGGRFHTLSMHDSDSRVPGAKDPNGQMTAEEVIQQMRNQKAIQANLLAKTGLFDSALDGELAATVQASIESNKGREGVELDPVAFKVTASDPALAVTPELMATAWLTEASMKAYVIRSEPVIIAAEWQDLPADKFLSAQGYGNAKLLRRKDQETLVQFRGRVVEFCNSKPQVEGSRGDFRLWMKNQHVLVRALVVSIGFTAIAQAMWWGVDVLFPYFGCEKNNASAMCWLFYNIRMQTIAYNNQIQWAVAAQVMATISGAAIFLLSFV